MFRFLEMLRQGPSEPHVRFMVRLKAAPAKDPNWITRVPIQEIGEAIRWEILDNLGFESSNFDAWSFSEGSFGFPYLDDYCHERRATDFVLAWVPSRGKIPNPNPVAPGAVDEFLRGALKDLHVDVVKWECQVVTPIREDRVELSIKGGE